MRNDVKKFTPTITGFCASQVPKAYSVESTTKSEALSLIENVLPIDISQYNVTFTKYYKTDLPPFLSNRFSSELVTYTLESEESVFDLYFNFENNTLTFCFISEKNAQSLVTIHTLT